MKKQRGSSRGDCPDFCPSKNGTVPFPAPDRPLAWSPGSRKRPRSGRAQRPGKSSACGPRRAGIPSAGGPAEEADAGPFRRVAAAGAIGRSTAPPAPRPRASPRPASRGPTNASPAHRVREGNRNCGCVSRPAVGRPGTSWRRCRSRRGAAGRRPAVAAARGGRSFWTMSRPFRSVP